MSGVFRQTISDKHVHLGRYQFHVLYPCPAVNLRHDPRSVKKRRRTESAGSCVWGAPLFACFYLFWHPWEVFNSLIREKPICDRLFAMQNVNGIATRGNASKRVSTRCSKRVSFEIKTKEKKTRLRVWLLHWRYYTKEFVYMIKVLISVYWWKYNI